MTFFSESDDYRERSLNIQISQVNVDKQYHYSDRNACGESAASNNRIYGQRAYQLLKQN